MIVGVGVDIIEIGRIEQALNRRGNRFRNRVFTPLEIEYCEAQGSKYASYAARFAAKEAAMKALGKGWFDGIGWTEIEISRNESEPPSISLRGNALARFHQLGGSRVHLSLSHSREIAIAHVILES